MLSGGGHAQRTTARCFCHPSRTLLTLGGSCRADGRQNRRRGRSGDAGTSHDSSHAPVEGCLFCFQTVFGDLDELAVSLRVARARGHDVDCDACSRSGRNFILIFDAGRRSSHWRWTASSQSRSGRVRDAYLRKMKVFLDRLEDFCHRTRR